MLASALLAMPNGCPKGRPKVHHRSRFSRETSTTSGQAPTPPLSSDRPHWLRDTNSRRSRFTPHSAHQPRGNGYDGNPLCAVWGGAVYARGVEAVWIASGVPGRFRRVGDRVSRVGECAAFPTSIAPPPSWPRPGNVRGRWCECPGRSIRPGGLRMGPADISLRQSRRSSSARVVGLCAPCAVLVVCASDSWWCARVNE